MSAGHRDRNKNKPKSITVTRTPSVFKLTPGETVLEDDHPVYYMYVYICDGVFTRNASLHGAMVAEFKRLNGYGEVRRCELFNHPGARLGDRVEIEGKTKHV